MPELEIFEDKTAMIGKRRKGRDESIDDGIMAMPNNELPSYKQDKRGNSKQ